MKTKFTKGNWQLNQTFMEGSPVPVSTVLLTDERIDMGTSPVICDLYGQWTEEGKANANLLLHAKDMFYRLVLEADNEGYIETLNLLEKILGFMPEYDTPEYSALIKEAKDYFKSK